MIESKSTLIHLLFVSSYCCTMGLNSKEAVKHNISFPGEIKTHNRITFFPYHISRNHFHGKVNIMIMFVAGKEEIQSLNAKKCWRNMLFLVPPSFGSIVQCYRLCLTLSYKRAIISNWRHSRFHSSKQSGSLLSSVHIL